MSATDPSTTPTPPPAAEPRHARHPGVVVTWVRVALACAVLMGSAAYRSRQVDRIKSRLDSARRGPAVKLSDIPLTLGAWKGEDTKLDPMIARATGADQIVTRVYVNQDTGVSIAAIMEYGPAVEMYVHSPEVCYPSAGFAQVAGPDIRSIELGKTSVPFRSLVYSKGEGGAGELQEVYYSWLYGGRWTPDIGIQKRFERIPSMYKVHLDRRANPGEKRDVGNPCESLLRLLLPEIDRRVTAQNPPPS